MIFIAIGLVIVELATLAGFFYAMSNWEKERRDLLNRVMSVDYANYQANKYAEKLERSKVQKQKTELEEADEKFKKDLEKVGSIT